MGEARRRSLVVLHLNELTAEQPLSRLKIVSAMPNSQATSAAG